MKLLADENVPSASVSLLRELGHDVTSVSDAMAGSPDRVVLDLSSTTDSIVLTFDLGFGRLVFRDTAALPAGLVLFRFVPATPQEPGELLQAVAMDGLPEHGATTSAVLRGVMSR